MWRCRQSSSTIENVRSRDEWMGIFLARNDGSFKLWLTINVHELEVSGEQTALLSMSKSFAVVHKHEENSDLEHLSHEHPCNHLHSVPDEFAIGLGLSEI